MGNGSLQFQFYQILGGFFLLHLQDNLIFLKIFLSRPGASTCGNTGLMSKKKKKKIFLEKIWIFVKMSHALLIKSIKKKSKKNGNLKKKCHKKQNKSKKKRKQKS